MKIRRLGLAAVAAGLALAGLSTATAAAEPSCADVQYIGAAGSGQRDGAGGQDQFRHACLRGCGREAG